MRTTLNVSSMPNQEMKSGTRARKGPRAASASSGRSAPRRGPDARANPEEEPGAHAETHAQAAGRARRGGTSAARRSARARPGREDVGGRGQHRPGNPARGRAEPPASEQQDRHRGPERDREAHRAGGGRETAGSPGPAGPTTARAARVERRGGRRAPSWRRAPARGRCDRRTADRGHRPLPARGLVDVEHDLVDGDVANDGLVLEEQLGHVLDSLPVSGGRDVEGGQDPGSPRSRFVALRRTRRAAPCR